MADDIDDLLREVEEKFLTSAQVRTEQKSTSAKTKITVNRKQISKAQSAAVLLSKEVEQDIVEILEECMEASTNTQQQKLSPRKTHSAAELAVTPANAMTNEKCFPVLLSGVLSPEEAAKYPKVCNSLRCYNCDFRVGQFNHLKWRPGTDYLFLRNNMPEFDRVRVKLATAKHHKAYAYPPGDDVEDSGSEGESPLPPKPSITESELSTDYWNVLRVVKYIRQGSPTATLLALCALGLHDLNSACNQVALENSDALDVLINVLDTDDYKCKIASLRILCRIVSSSERFRRSLVAKSGLSSLVNLLSEPQQEVRCLAAGTLAHAVRDPRSRKLACKAGAVPLLVDLLDVEFTLNFSKPGASKAHCPAKHEAATAAANALWALCLSSTARKALRLAGGISLLIRTLISSSGEKCEATSHRIKKRSKSSQNTVIPNVVANCELLIAVTGVLERCAEEECFRQSVKGETFLSELVRLLKLATQNEELQTHCASAISHFAEDPANRRILLKLKAAEVLILVLRQHDLGSRSSLLKSLATAVWKFSLLPEAADRLRELGIVNLLIIHLNDQNEDVMVPIVSTLSMLAKDAVSLETLNKGGAVPRLVWLLSGNHPELLAAAALTVANLTADRESLELLENLDAARLLWSLLKHPRASVQAAAACAIAAFSQYSHSAGEVSRSLVGGLELLVSLLRASDLEVVTAAASAVARMAVEDETLAVLSDHHVVTLLAGLVKSKNQQLQLNVAEAIAQCCRWPGNPEQFGLAGGVKPLIPYLKSKNFQLKRAAVKALHQVSFYQANCAVLLGSKAIPILLKLVGHDDHTIQESAAGCLANIRKFTRTS